MDWGEFIQRHIKFDLFYLATASYWSQAEGHDLSYLWSIDFRDDLLWSHLIPDIFLRQTLDWISFWAYHCSTEILIRSLLSQRHDRTMVAIVKNQITWDLIFWVNGVRKLKYTCSSSKFVRLKNIVITLASDQTFAWVLSAKNNIKVFVRDLIST